HVVVVGRLAGAREGLPGHRTRPPVARCERSGGARRPEPAGDGPGPRRGARGGRARSPCRRRGAFDGCGRDPRPRGTAARAVRTAALPELMEMDLRHAVPRVRVPAIVLVGEHDRVTPPAGAVALTAALPEGRLVVIPDAGHIPMLETPEPVVRELRGFARAVLQ